MEKSTGKESLDIANQNEVLDDPEVQRLVLAAATSENRYLSDLVEKLIIGKTVQRQQSPFTSPTPSGTLEIGRTDTGAPFRLSEEELSKHLLAVGESGAGKTTLFYTLVSQLEAFETQSDLLQRTIIDRAGEQVSLPDGSLDPDYVARHNTALGWM